MHGVESWQSGPSAGGKRSHLAPTCIWLQAVCMYRGVLFALYITLTVYSWVAVLSDCPLHFNKPFNYTSLLPETCWIATPLSSDYADGGATERTDHPGVVLAADRIREPDALAVPEDHVRWTSGQLIRLYKQKWYIISSIFNGVKQNLKQR